MSTYISAISFHHKVNGLLDNTTNFSVSKMLEGYRRVKPSQDCRTPIVFETLVLIIDQLNQICISPFEVSLFRAAYTMAFFGLFRVGELVFFFSGTGRTSVV